MVLEQAIPYSAMSKACDELFLTVLKSEMYTLSRLDDRERLVFTSRSPSFVFYIDIICLGEKPGEVQIFAY